MHDNWLYILFGVKQKYSEHLTWNELSCESGFRLLNVFRLSAFQENYFCQCFAGVLASAYIFPYFLKQEVAGVYILNTFVENRAILPYLQGSPLDHSVSIPTLPAFYICGWTLVWRCNMSRYSILFQWVISLKANSSLLIMSYVYCFVCTLLDLRYQPSFSAGNLWGNFKLGCRILPQLSHPQQGHLYSCKMDAHGST